MAAPQVTVHLPAVAYLLLCLAMPLDLPPPLLLLSFILLYACSISYCFPTSPSGGASPPSSASKNSGAGAPRGIRGNSDDFQDFTVAVTQARYQRGKTQYRIDLSYEGEHWNVWRSYSEILAFYQRHPPKDPKVAPFPGKSSTLEFLSGADTTIQFVEARKRQLDTTLRHALSSKERFQVAVALNRDAKTGKSPSATFLAVPAAVDLSGAQVGLSREELVEAGVKGLRVAWEHVHKIVGEGTAPWKIFNRSKDGVDLYFYEDGPRINHAVRSEISINAVDLLEFLTDGEERLTWDATFAGHTVFEEFTFQDDQEQANVLADLGLKLIKARVVHARTRSPARLIVSDRDSVVVSILAQRLSDGALILSIKSVEDERAPPADSGGYIRVDVQNNITLLEPVPGKEDACLFRTAGETDLKANVPKSFVKVFAPNKAAEVATFAKMARDRAKRKPSKIRHLLAVK